MQKILGWIKFTDNRPDEPLLASYASKALEEGMKALGLRSLTRRNLLKVHARSIHWAGRILFPVDKKRTLDKRRDHHYNKQRTGVPQLERRDIGRRRHTVHPFQIAA